MISQLRFIQRLLVQQDIRPKQQSLIINPILELVKFVLQESIVMQELLAEEL